MTDFFRRFKTKHWFLVGHIALQSYREVQILVDRGSWKIEDVRIVFWYFHWEEWYKNFDSFHAIHGLAYVCLFAWVVEYLPKYYPKFIKWNWLNYVIWIVIYWVLFMQLRNLFMHQIF